MAKTVFIQGTIVQPAFLNSIFNHDHNGQDDDGHSPKINPDTEISNCSFGGFSVPFVGFTTSIQVNAFYRINENIPQSGFPKVVEIFFPEVYGVSNGNDFYASNVIPTSIRPAINGASGSGMVTIVNGGNIRHGRINFNWDGSIVLSVGLVSGSEISYNSTGWATSGAKGIYACCIKYPIF